MTDPAGRPGVTPPGASERGVTKPSAAKPGAAKPGAGKPGAGKPGAAKPSAPKTGATRAGGAAPGGAGAAGRPRGGRPERADPARRAVFDVLLAVAKRGAYANLLLPSVLRERGLTGRDAALATELCYGTLRGQGTYDAILGVCSDRRVAHMDPPVREVLRLGVHQLLATRIAAHAAVATSVDLAKDVVGVRPAGFVNAVLRRVSTRSLDDWIAVVAPDRGTDLVGYLAARHSYPRWIVEAFGVAFGEVPGEVPGGARVGAGHGEARTDELAQTDLAHTELAQTELAQTEEALAAGNIGPRVTLCAIPGVCDRDELVAVSRGEPARWSPFGVYLAQGDPAAIPAVSQRRATVQDEASQLAALALARAELTSPDRPSPDRPSLDQPNPDQPNPDQPNPDQPNPDQHWLDLCAGPGGKAAVLAGLARARGARLLAADVRERRAALARDVLAGATGPPGEAGVAGEAGAPVVVGGGGSAGLGEGATGVAGPTGAGATGSPGVVVADGTVRAWRAGGFDRVLADVPCSGLGSLRRRPEARWRRSPGQLTELAPLQRSLLAVALDSVRPGGVVAYVTCSPHLAETRDVVGDVLGARQDAEVLDAPALLPEVAGLGCPEPFGKYVQFWPHRHATDAIFLAVIRRRG
jgi:16S rRNA (cytosine967-C5)-methyltransferase